MLLVPKERRTALVEFLNSLRFSLNLCHTIVTLWFANFNKLGSGFNQVAPELFMDILAFSKIMLETIRFGTKI